MGTLLYSFYNVLNKRKWKALASLIHSGDREDWFHWTYEAVFCFALYASVSNKSICYVCFSVLYIYIFERNKCWFVDISITMWFICLFFLFKLFSIWDLYYYKIISFINCSTLLFQKCYIFTRLWDCKLQKQYLTMEDKNALVRTRKHHY